MLKELLIELLLKKKAHLMSSKMRAIEQVAIENLLNSLINIEKGAIPNYTPGVSCVIFSKDRPVQLFSLLGSMIELISPKCTTYVIYRSENHDYNMAYEQVFSYFPEITAIKEVDFREDLLEVLKKIETEKLFFLVDDIIFTKRTNIDDLLKIDSNKYLPSLRLGRNLNWCFPVARKQPLPVFQDLQGYPGLITWDWKSSKLDWAYPMSVDGHIFDSHEMKVMANALPFKAPNSFETALTIFAPLFFKRRGVCFEKSILVNFANNRVQSEAKNRSGNVNSDFYIEKWANGLAIDWRKFVGYENKSCHETCELMFTSRSDVMPKP